MNIETVQFRIYQILCFILCILLVLTWKIKSKENFDVDNVNTIIVETDSEIYKGFEILDTGTYLVKKEPDRNDKYNKIIIKRLK